MSEQFRLLSNNVAFFRNLLNVVVRKKLPSVKVRCFVDFINEAVYKVASSSYAQQLKVNICFVS